MTERRGHRVVSMATGTIASRATGLLRVLVLAYVLGFAPLADAFNLANTVPNMLFDLVLGGMMSATFIPVFVEHLARDGERRAWRSISTVVTAAMILLVAACALAWLVAPWIIGAFTVLGHSGTTGAHVARERAVATSLLRWFVPQILFYGLIGIGTSLLNIRQRFAAPAWVPVANNLVCIAVLVWFHVVDAHPTLGSVEGTSRLAWLAAGTSAGVAIQFLLLVPSMARADLWRLSFRLDLADPALRTVARLGTWTLLVVLSNQASLYVILALAFALGGQGPISAYTYGWAFMQMPYAVVVVSVLNALTPELAHLWATDGRREFSRRLARGLRQSLVLIIPVTALLIVLAQPIVAVLLNRLNGQHHLLAGTTLAVLAAGLPGFTVFMVAIRGLQAMKRQRDTFFLYLFENGATIAFAFFLGRHSMGGLMAAISIGYTAAAVAAVVVLARRGARLGPGIANPPVRRALVAAVVAGVVMALAYNVTTWSSGPGLLARLVEAAAAGAAVYGVVVVLGHRRRLRALGGPAGKD